MTVFAALALASCVSSTPVPPSDLSAALSPTVADSADIATITPALTDTNGAAATQTALAETPAEPEASQLAVENAAKGDEKPKTSEKAKTEIDEESTAKNTVENQVATAPAIPVSRPTPPPNPKRSLLASLFQSKPTAKPAAKTVRSGTVKRPRASVRIQTRSALPGVRSKRSLFEIFTSRGRDPDLDEPIELASLSNLARRGNFGLLLQTKNVRVGCFPRKLVVILKRVERHFGRTPVVTSGYRSRAKNRRVRGARNSTHIACRAADIQVKGVSKWQLAKYLRSIPGRGGVGTYCHTKSVHIDIGKKRDWNWRCRRRKKRT